MPDATAADYVTKTEAAQIYRRSERSISRDITNALKHRDKRILQHVELRLEDGSRQRGLDLSIEQVVKYRDEGLNPTWLLKTDWLTKFYGRRDEPRPMSAGLPPNLPSSDTVTLADPLPDDLLQRVSVLSAQNAALQQSNADLRTQAQRLEKELDRRAEERREETELQKQSNVLMQQVYTMLSAMQDSAGKITVLPAPRQVTEAANFDSAEPEAVSRKGTSPAASKTPVNEARGPRSKKRARSRQPKPKASAENQNAPTEKRKYFPGLARFFRR